MTAKSRTAPVCVFLSRPLLEQLQWYVEQCDALGEYAGNRKQFDARHIQIIAWLKRELEVTPK